MYNFRNLELEWLPDKFSDVNFIVVIIIAKLSINTRTPQYSRNLEIQVQCVVAFLKKTVTLLKVLMKARTMNKPVSYRYFSNDYIARHVLKKCQSLILEPTTEGARWSVESPKVIIVDVIHLPATYRGQNKLHTTITNLMRTAALAVETIVIDHVDNHIRLYLAS